MALVVSFSLFMIHSLPTLIFGYSLNYGEGVLLDQVRRIEVGDGLYPSFDEPPYVIDNYPPVYPYLARWIPGPDHAPFFGGRLLSILATLVSAGAITVLIRRRSGDAAGLLGGAVFLLLPEVQRFSVLMRVDMLGLALGLVGLTAFTASGRAWRGVGVVAFFLSVYTRHSMLVLPLAGSILVLAREGRRAVPAISTLIAAGIGAFLIGDLALGGRLHEHLVNFNVLSFEVAAIESKWLLMQWPGGLLLVVAAFLSLRPTAAERRSVSWSGTVYWILLGLALLFVGRFAIDCLRQEQGSSPTVWSRLGVGAQNAHARNQLEAEIRTKQTELAEFERRPNNPENGRSILALQSRIRRLEEEIAPYPTLSDLAVSHLLLGIAGIAAIATGVRRRRYQGKTSSSPTGEQGLFIGLGLASATLIGRSGSDVNYLLEYLTLLLLAAGWGLSKGTPDRRAVPATIVVLLILLGGGVGAYAFLNRDTQAQKLEEKAKATERILAPLREIRGPLLSENPAIPAILGRPVVYQTFMYGQLYASGEWDPGPLVAEIRKRAFAAVVREAGLPYAGIENEEAFFASPVWLRSRTFPAPIHEAVVDNYTSDGGTRSLERITPRYFVARAIWWPKE